MTKMKDKTLHVVVAGFDGAVASAITGIIDLLALAGVSWNRIQKQQIQRLFHFTLVSPNGEPIRCINGLSLVAQSSYTNIQTADLFIVPTIGAPIEATLANHPKLITLIQDMHQRGTMIAGNCTGIFFLAESGILDGRIATTHWGFTEQFQTRYPKVKLQPQQMMTRDGHIYTAGGGLAWFDLGLHLIERFYGFETALQTARSFVLDYQRDHQLSYALFRISRPHQDIVVQQIQHYLTEHIASNISLHELAAYFNLTTRTLIRRFKAALDVPPYHYVQAIRMEAAQKRLEQTEQPIEQIMLEVGYQDASAFRRVFKQHTGLTPIEYRRRFSRYATLNEC